MCYCGAVDCPSCCPAGPAEDPICEACGGVVVDGARFCVACEDVEPKRGLRFEHARFLREDLRGPAIYRVTKVARGLVYYRNEEPDGTLSGAPVVSSVEKWHRYVRKVLDATAVIR